MANLKPFQDHFFLMLEAGFISVNQGDEKSAYSLFNAAHLLNPESSFPEVGIGYLHLLKLEVTDAIASFETVLAKDPDNEMAKTLLGVSCGLSKDKVSKGEEILQKVEKESDTSEAKESAKVATDFINTFVKNN